MFTTYPSYSPYRVLALVRPLQRGEDVYALQNAINAVVGSSLTADGTLGEKTSRGIFAAQQAVNVAQDGKAGVVTQRALALRIVRNIITGGAQFSLTKGQLEHESSYLLGNYSPKRPNGSFDAGVAQMNTEHTPARDGFNPTYAIAHLISNTKQHWGFYHDTALYRGNDRSDRRRWMLAAGSWNAPAFANYLAGVQPWAVPGADALQLFEAYMASVSVYLS